MWAAAIELDAVPLQEHFGTGDTGLALEDQKDPCSLKISRDDDDDDDDHDDDDDDDDDV